MRASNSLLNGVLAGNLWRSNVHETTAMRLLPAVLRSELQSPCAADLFGTFDIDARFARLVNRMLHDPTSRHEPDFRDTCQAQAMLPGELLLVSRYSFGGTQYGLSDARSGRFLGQIFNNFRAQVRNVLALPLHGSSNKFIFCFDSAILGVAEATMTPTTPPQIMRGAKFLQGGIGRYSDGPSTSNPTINGMVWVAPDRLLTLEHTSRDDAQFSLWDVAASPPCLKGSLRCPCRFVMLASGTSGPVLYAATSKGDIYKCAVDTATGIGPLSTEMVLQLVTQPSAILVMKDGRLVVHFWEFVSVYARGSAPAASPAAAATSASACTPSPDSAGEFKCVVRARVAPPEQASVLSETPAGNIVLTVCNASRESQEPVEPVFVVRLQCE